MSLKDELEIRTLSPADHEAWLALWRGYQAFYRVDIADDVTALTWDRFFDEAEPVFGLGACAGDELVGIAHYLFHRSTWTKESYCYFHDLFTAERVRGRGVGRALIEAVGERAKAAGAARCYWLTHESNKTARRLYDNLAERTGFIHYRLPA